MMKNLIPTTIERLIPLATLVLVIILLCKIF